MSGQPSDADIDAVRVLLGGSPRQDDDRLMFHPTGGRLAGADSCVHTFAEYGKHGVYRHHVFTPDSKVTPFVTGDPFCVCGFTEASEDGAELHQPCWLTTKGN